MNANCPITIIFDTLITQSMATEWRITLSTSPITVAYYHLYLGNDRTRKFANLAARNAAMGPHVTERISIFSCYRNDRLLGSYTVRGQGHEYRNVTHRGVAMGDTGVMPPIHHP